MSVSRILIIDDYPIFRSGLALILRSGLGNIAIEEAGSLDQALRPGVVEPALVLLDIRLQSLSGLERSVILKQRWPKSHVVMLSANEAEPNGRTALVPGATTFVRRSETAANLVGILQRVIRNDFSNGASTAKADGQAHMTPRQYQVLNLICQGLPNKTIGRHLNLSENTVRGHVQGVLAFLDVPSRTKAAFEARRRGLVG
jgi:DNA-binding NarL/FixJ family response regulator